MSPEEKEKLNDIKRFSNYDPSTADDFIQALSGAVEKISSLPESVRPELRIRWGKGDAEGEPLLIEGITFPTGVNLRDFKDGDRGFRFKDCVFSSKITIYTDCINLGLFFENCTFSEPPYFSSGFQVHNGFTLDGCGPDPLAQLDFSNLTIVGFFQLKNIEVTGSVQWPRQVTRGGFRLKNCIFNEMPESVLLNRFNQADNV